MRKRYPGVTKGVSDDILMALQHLSGLGDARIYLDTLERTKSYEAAQEALNQSIEKRTGKAPPTNKTVFEYLNNFSENLKRIAASKQPQIIAPKKQPVINPNPTFEVLPRTKVQTEPQIFKQPTVNPNPTFTASPYATPQTVQPEPKVEQPVDSRFKVIPDVLPKIERQPETKQIVKEESSPLESIGIEILTMPSKISSTISDVWDQGTNWLQRNSDKTSDEPEPTVAKEIAPVNATRNFSRATGEKIQRDDRRYYTPEIIDLKQNQFGFRNRGDLKPLETEGAVITTFHPFKKVSVIKNEKIPANATFIGVDDNGNLKVGNIKEFNNTDEVSRVFSNKVIDFVYNKDGSVKLAKKNADNPNNPVPIVKVKTDNGKIVEGHINFLTKEGIKNPYDQFGNIQGGRTILKTKDKTILVSGSVNNLVTEFNKLKKTTNEPIEVITLDNGSYNLGLRTYDRKLTSKDLKKHDLQNRGGGNFLYLKGYSQENYQTPNVRTKEDESYKKGHSLKNEVKAVVLHHTAYEEPTLDNVHKQFMTLGQNSSHVVINYDGSRIKYAEPEQVTFHAGKSKFLNREEVNDFGIGIEFQGDTNKKPLTEDQINSAIEYLIPIIDKYNIPIENITTHAIIAGERKQDINDKEYKRFLTALKNKYYSK